MGNRAFKIIIPAFAVLIGIVLISYMSQVSEKKQMHIGDAELQVEVADTILLRAQGLSDREELCFKCGMVFIYDDKKIRKFWMKDMHFALDVFWISNGVIVGMQENVPFEPKNGEIARFQSNVEAEWVLEVNAGYIAKTGLKIGDTVDIDLN